MVCVILAVVSYTWRLACSEQRWVQSDRRATHLAFEVEGLTCLLSDCTQRAESPNGVGCRLFNVDISVR